jgi:hypothetical protein
MTTLEAYQLDFDNSKNVLELKDLTSSQKNEQKLAKDDLDKIYGSFGTGTGALLGGLAGGTNYLINNGSSSSLSGLGKASFGGALTGGLLGFASSSGMF